MDFEGLANHELIEFKEKMYWDTVVRSQTLILIAVVREYEMCKAVVQVDSQ